MGTNITGIGNANAIGFKSRVTGGAYFPPELKDALVGVWSAYGKSNDSTDRNIIKNKIKDKGGDFVISNAAYKLNSGYGKYEEDFTDWRIYPNIKVTDNVITTNGNFNSTWFIYKHSSESKINEMNIKVSGIPKGGKILYFYISDETDNLPIKYTIPKDGIYHLPESKINNNRVSVGFTVESRYDWNNIRIEQIPSFEGAFVTDGVNDLITSTKTVQEMLGGSNEITVVSMIHQIGLISSQSYARNNYFIQGNDFLTNTISAIGKIGIYGYKGNLSNIAIVNDILGDKKDYSVDKANPANIDSVFSVNGTHSSAQLSSVAWYWTIIANKVLTTDQINQVIAYFNLDRTLKPDILCNTIKQGITNENHAEFGDKLIDYSGNGRDIQLNNIAWKGNSGIGKYEVDFLDWVINSPFINERTSFTFSSSNDTNNDIITIYQRVPAATQSFKIKAKLRGRVLYRYYVNNGDTISISYYEVKEGINILPDSADPTSVNGKVGFVLKGLSSVKVEQVPFHAGGLCLDGINDSGKVTGMPIYKDYTFIIDYERISYTSSEVWTASVVSKAHTVGQGAFILMLANREVELSRQSNSFGSTTTFNRDDFTRTLLYQSKYKCGDVNLTVGEGIDGDTLWLGTLRDNDYRFFNGAIYSLMSFPYSMSEFLIERQLKKHKLGTLYPNMVEFRPVIKANDNYKIFYTALLPLTGIVWEKINIGDYIPVGRRVAIQLSFDNEASELVSAISSQLGNISITKNSNNKGYTIFGDILKNKSPQNINITIDEYIRYEDIVQPYPSLFTLIDYDTEEVYSWGSKLKVGARFKGNVVNLLPNMYEWQGNVLYNGEVLDWGIKPGVVAKEMVFSWNMPFKYLIDNNEPKVILSPRLLRIPNSSYKLLGYIPDISGHGNNGVINNSAYAEGSGVNEDGSFQFDGVDDFVTIPTLSSGGKQVLMKVNSRKSDCYLYDQRNNWTQYLGIVSTKDFIAYNYSNQRGKTYIDGILNENITANDLIGITHNITVTNNRDDVKQYSPCIGTSFARDSYAQMALYDFMLFDDISTDDKIKQLNEYVGIEAKVELPPYYWDAYGKTNLDGDKATIQQRGVAVGDYDLINYNHAYEGMSGYNGYPVVFGANKTWEILSSAYSYIYDVTSTTIHVTMVKNAGTGLLFSYVKKDEALTNIKEIPAFRVTVKGLEGNSKFAYRYLATEDATKETLVYLGNGTHELAKSFAPTEALLDLTRNAWVGIFITPMVEGEVVFDCDITIEVLPEYENGLVYDGITDYSKNANIPALDDFTAIIKREWLKKQGCPLIKGSKVYEGGNGNALLLEWDKAYNFVFYKRTDIMEGEVPDNISFITPTNYNGNVITRGSEQDTNGICIAGDGNAGFANMIFYKLILYPKTIPLLQINFLKNLMERDEIIDLTNPIFIKDE